MAFLLALDQGTTSSRAILFTLEGRPVAVAKREFRQLYPKPGWVEHDPLEIWETTLWAAREVLRRAGAEAGEVLALGITNQRETTLLWDRKTGKPLHNAIVWQDRRTTPLCEALRAKGLEPLFRERTGLLFDPYFSGTKLVWLLENVPGLKARAEGAGWPSAPWTPGSSGTSRGEGPRHRPHEREPHPALQPPHPRLGPGAS